jgi:aminoglycoside phosphotransferase
MPTDVMPPPLPDRLAALLRGYTRAVVVTGLSSARVERCTAPGRPALFLKFEPLGGPHPLEDEIVRLVWMASTGLPVPRIVAHFVEDGVQYLLTEELPGVDASVARDNESRRTIVGVLAGALRRLHSMPIADCPFVHPAASRVEEAARRVAAGFVDAREFDACRAGLSAQEVLAMLVAAHEALVAKRRTGDAAPEGAVLTHGDYCLPNIILRGALAEPVAGWDADGAALSGFVDCGRAGVADPYQDLALGARSITYNFGREWAPVFLEDYGLRIADRERLSFYTLLDEFF